MNNNIFLTNEIKAKFLLFLNAKFMHYEKVEDFKFFTKHFYNEYSANSFRLQKYIVYSKENATEKVFNCLIYKGITFIGKIDFLKKDGTWILLPDHS